MGGVPWKPTIYSNLILTTMNMFDLIDIQRVRHPKVRKFTYESKFFRVKSRIDFFLIAKDLTVNIKKSEILSAIAPDLNAISISLTLPNECLRGPGFWKFNNILLKDPQYIDKIRYTYTQARKYYGHLTDRRLFWEMIKMEIRSATITYSKNKSKSIRNREQELVRKLHHLDGIIYNNFSPHSRDFKIWYGWGLVRRTMLKITSGDVMTHALVRPSRRSLAFYYGELHPLAYSSLREYKSVVFFHFQSCFHCLSKPSSEIRY